MFVPHDFGIALGDDDYKCHLLGLWANTYKGVKNYRFELFYWGLAGRYLLISSCACITMEAFE